MKHESYRQVLNSIISFIKDGEINAAIKLIREQQLQHLAGKILYTVLINRSVPQNNCIRFVDQYTNNNADLLWYNNKGEKRSVLLDFTKVLGNLDTYPPLWEKSSEMMRQFICDFMRRDGEVNVNGLYIFRSPTEYILSEITQGEISVSSPDTFNDPFDCLILSSIRNVERKELEEMSQKYSNKTFIDELKKIRVRCFIGAESKINGMSPVLNPLMWAHYADSHKGICIKYILDNNSPLLKSGLLGTLTRGRIDHVIYEDKLVEINNDALDYNNCFLVKNKVWEYEDEYRLVYYDAYRDDKYYTVPLVELGLKIEDVYLGLNCEKAYRQLIQNLIKDQRIGLFHIERDTNYLNKLKVEKGAFLSSKYSASKQEICVQ